ncbi:hypothetical protein BACCOPRO_00925 [Phocaeicola coprophilus DSM 18228 = JCM 13818]|uniref:Uncharacterized protein n=1 Tax=Phocaeicola coprophilus DSM 18228 = JCM 13818 TaxID=547042 RepID=S0FA54_9BACT|nr:hypothetical protein BACCOPRO_00925 [Phocaeicola coprophilus DSM 18228 = JCM 13818]
MVCAKIMEKCFRIFVCSKRNIICFIIVIFIHFYLILYQYD